MGVEKVCLGEQTFKETWIIFWWQHWDLPNTRQQRILFYILRGASASSSVLPMSIQGWFALRLTGLISLLDFQESSPAPQFKGISTLAFCLLSCPALTTVRDHWEDHSLDYTDLCRQSDISAFQHTVYVVIAFLEAISRKQSSYDFMAAVIICSDFRAQEEEICHYFCLFLF